MKIPNHVGIIMDGNRRWAKEKGKNPLDGHVAGLNRITSLAEYVFNKGVNFLTIYAFSTENFKREEKEVKYLMNLAIKAFKNEIGNLHKKNIKIVFSGREDPLSDEILNIIDEVEEKTKENTKGTLNICFNYGGRAEIIDAVNELIESGEKITEDDFGKNLYKDLPDLDYVIRTSGEMRMSNFMLWQISYAELYFPECYFPDFDEKEFDKALLEYNSRIRRFGGNG